MKIMELLLMLITFFPIKDQEDGKDEKKAEKERQKPCNDYWV